MQPQGPASRPPRRAPLLLGVATALLLALPTFGAPAADTLPSPAPDPFAPAASPPEAPASFAASAVSFEENLGQFEPATAFLLRGPGYVAEVRPSEIVLRPDGGQWAPPAVLAAPLRPAGLDLDAGAVRLVLPGAATAVSGSGPLPDVANYYIGRDPAAWRTGARHVSSVTLSGVRPGVDLQLLGDADGQLELQWLLAPAADPADARLDVLGAAPRVDAAGALVLDAAAARVRLAPPVAWQGRPDDPGAPVAAAYRVDGARVGYALGRHDPAAPLTIDPPVSFLSSYETIGGADATHVTVDAAGNVFEAGGGGFVRKYDAGGTPVWTTVVQASDGAAYGNGIALDGSGYVYVGGLSVGGFFPVQWAFFGSATCAGNSFLFRLRPTGTFDTSGTTTYSTCIGSNGGSGTEIKGIAVDAANQAAFVGYTSDSSYPRAAADQSAFGGGSYDAFVGKVNSPTAGVMAFVFSTFLGGSNSDFGYAMAQDGAGNLFVAGTTTSPNFPVRSPYMGTNPCACSSAFEAEYTSAGARLVSTYFGGASTDVATGVAVDASANVYLTGYTSSSNLPVTGDGTTPAQGARGGSYDAFVAKLGSGGSTLRYATYFGGTGDDRGADVQVLNGYAYVTGQVLSSGYTAWADKMAAADTGTLGGTTDAFLVKVGLNGEAFLLATPFGGSNADAATSLRAFAQADGNPRLLMSGTTTTSGSNFPLRNPYSTAATGTTSFLIEVCYTCLTPPRALQATAGPGRGEIVLTWNQPLSLAPGWSLDHYTVYSKKGTYAPPLPMPTYATLPGQYGGFDDTGLGDGEVHCYQVTVTLKFATATLESAPSVMATPNQTHACAQTLGTLSPPTGLTATAGPGAGQITVDWNAVAGATGYNLYSAATASGPFGPPVLWTGTAPPVVDGGLGNGQQRCYEVSALNVVGEGSRSAPACATTFGPPCAPTLAVSSTTAGLTLTSTVISWTPGCNGGAAITGYRIEVMTQVLSPAWAVAANVGPTPTSWTDGSITAPLDCYRVSAQNAVGLGPASNAVCSHPL